MKAGGSSSDSPLDSALAGMTSRTKPPPAPKVPPAALLGAALHALSEGVFLARCRLAPDGLRIAYANEAFCRMTGYTTAELAARGHGFLHVNPGDLPSLRRWHRTLTKGKPLQGDGRLRHRNGAELYAAWTYSALRDVRGRVTHIIAAYQDLTERHRLEEALIHSQRLDAVGRLAGGVAHDFNNLLSVINGYCEILADSLSDRPKARKEVAEIHHAGQKATMLVRQLLAFSRQQALAPRIIEVNQLVRENADIFQRLLKPDKALVLSLGVEAGNVRADPAQLRQVLLNLVLNARDALGAGGRVTLGTARREIRGRKRRPADVPPGCYVVLAVSDNGTGMDAGVRSHLFEPFFTTKDEGQGTGLGLALVYGVVQQSGGYIRVHSAPTAGSTFELYLPAVAESAEHLSISLPPLPVTGGRETLLVIEDDDVVRKMVAGILTSDGYAVVACRTPAEGLHEVRRLAKPVHLVCLDLDDRHRDGERLVRALQALQPTLRTVNISNHETPVLAWLAASRQTTLTKPYALGALLRAVRTLLDHP